MVALQQHASKQGVNRNEGEGLERVRLKHIINAIFSLVLINLYYSDKNIWQCVSVLSVYGVNVVSITNTN